MPTPVGHALAGLAVHALLTPARRDLLNRPRILCAAGAALAPDLDLLFRFFDGRNHHQAETHGIGFAIVAAIVVALSSRGVDTMALAVRSGLGWVSHILLDLLGRDTHPPIGLMALWPFSYGWFKSPWTPFMDVGRTLDATTLRHDLVAVSWEVALLLPVLLACTWRFREE